MSTQRQRSWLLRFFSLIILALLISGANTACGPQKFGYSVVVQEEDTGKKIQNAEVTIYIDGETAPPSTFTDSHGYTRIDIKSSYDGYAAKLEVNAPGYNPHTQSISLIKGGPPQEVALQSEAAPTNDNTPNDQPEQETTSTRTPLSSSHTPVPTPIPLPTMTPTVPPTPTTAPTSSPLPPNVAVAIMSAGIFAAPDANSQELGGVSAGGQVVVLGRSAYGQWLYIRNNGGVEGFTYAPRFEWTGNYESLPVRESTVPLPTALPTSTPTPTVPPPPLEMDLWQLPGTGRCEGGGWYMSIYFEVIREGNGVYTYYWNEQKLAGPLSDESYTFELFTTEGAIVGTGRVVSGDGQTAEKGLHISAPDCAQ